MKNVKKGTCRRRKITYETFCLTCQEEAERAKLELISGPAEIAESEVNLTLKAITAEPETELEPTSWSLRPEVSSVEGEKEENYLFLKLNPFWCRLFLKNGYSLFYF